MNNRLERDEFFYNTKVIKLANKIAKASKNGFTYLYIKDEETIELLCNNTDWLDYIGIVVVVVVDDKKIKIRWERL